MQFNIKKEKFLPCYWHLLNTDADINFLWGGRDSGKSHFITQKLVLECLASKNFRCILIKKTFESIKDAQFQNIKDLVYAWGLDAFFDFKVSPLEITCKLNGNKFIARGCDKPEKMKSISNPTHAWYEEGNQLTQEDYIVASTTLRNPNGPVKQWFSFNPEANGDYTEFWLYKDWFATYAGDMYSNFTDYKTTTLSDGREIKIKYTSTHTTYTDNKYCTDERKANIEVLALLNPYYYTTFTLGKWGNKQNDSPFVFAYERTKHVGTPEPTRKEILYLSFDFNKNPICCSVIQHYAAEIKIIETIKLPNSDIYKMCLYIRTHYPNYQYIVTGDASGQSGSAMVKDNLNYYVIIKNELNISTLQMKVPKANPRIEDNQVLVNAIFALYKVTMHQTKAKHLIFDVENVRMLPQGTIDKTDRKDPAKQADALDTLRYWMNSFMWDFLKKHGIRA